MLSTRAETWHPCGYGFGPVVYVQRFGVEPTGMFFLVPRWKFWAISALVFATRLAIIGCAARRLFARMQVTYQWTSNGERGQA